MSMSVIGRRRLFALAIALLARPLARPSPSVASQPQVFKGTYAADVGILYDMFTLQLRGGIEETVDLGIGEYRVTAIGEGPNIQNRFESSGVLREGRWKPVRSQSWFDIRGRQSRTDVVYDWSKRRVEYRARGETFFLRRVRVVDDVVSLPDGIHIDDVMTATLNYADGRWPAQADGVHRTLVVRRRRAENEGPDDIASSYRAEIVPLELKAVQDRSGKPAALFDLSRFSSWAKPSQPARIVFAPSRRPESITSSMILGTSVTIRFAAI
jgi:hypothetical protein